MGSATKGIRTNQLQQAEPSNAIEQGGDTIERAKEKKQA
jgi:hypothetical protein